MMPRQSGNYLAGEVCEIRSPAGTSEGRGRGKPAIAGAAPANKQKITEPRRKEWAAEGSASMCSNRLYHPLALLGVLILFFELPRVPSLRVSTLGYLLPPCGLRIPQAAPALLRPGLKFRGRADRKLQDKLAFITFLGGARHFASSNHYIAKKIRSEISPAGFMRIVLL